MSSPALSALGGSEQQMHVVGHEGVGVDGATEAGSQFRKLIQVTPVVLLRIKAHGAIVAPLDDVPGDAGEA